MSLGRQIKTQNILRLSARNGHGGKQSRDSLPLRLAQPLFLSLRILRW